MNVKKTSQNLSQNFRKAAAKSSMFGRKNYTKKKSKSWRDCKMHVYMHHENIPLITSYNWKNIQNDNTQTNHEKPHREHGRAVLKCVGQARHACVVGQAGVAVAGRQCGVEKGLLRGVVRLTLVLLRLLSQRGGRSRGRRVTSTKLW